MIKIVVISDTHGQLSQLDIPEGDILVHCGDWSYLGRQDELVKFGNHLRKLKFKHKLIIPGNHDLTMDELHPHYHKNARKWMKLEGNTHLVINNFINLEGINFYCTSMIPAIGNWAFGYANEVKRQVYEEASHLPIDIVVSHCPPFRILDEHSHYGCKELKTFIDQVKPDYHFFGHCHDDYGIKTVGKTTFVNAASCDLMYHPTHKPIIIEVDYDSKRR